MNARRLTGFGLLALGAGIGAASLLGPLALAMIRFHITSAMENQLIGGDAISLILVAPAAVLAGLLWLRGHRLAPALALGPALYAAYTYPQYVLIPDYARYPGNNERFFLLFAGLTLLGWLIAVQAWRALGQQPLPGLSARLRRTLAGIFLLTGGLFALAWGQQITVVMTGGVPTPEYLEHPTGFWLIKLLDTTIVIPVALATGLGLLRNGPGAVKAAYGLASFYTCLGGAVAAMAVVMQVRQDPSANPLMTAVLLPLVAGLALVTVQLFRSGLHSPAEPARPISSTHQPLTAGD